MPQDSTAALTGLPIAWSPSPEYLERSRLRRFMEAQGFSRYEDFLAWSVAEPARFWDAVMRDLDLRFYQPYDRVLDQSRGPEWTTWFPGGLYNYVHNAVDRRAGDDREAVIWEGDDGAARTLTFRELALEVDRAAAGLRALGLAKGDRVGIFMPMVPETVIATLAVNKLGAVYVPIFSGYGAEAVAQRLQDSEARFLVTADGFLRRGKTVPMKETADAAVALSPTVERVIVVARLGRPTPTHPTRDLPWAHLTHSATTSNQQPPTSNQQPPTSNQQPPTGNQQPPTSNQQPATSNAPPATSHEPTSHEPTSHEPTSHEPTSHEPTSHTSPEDPCLIIYTSGTTGRPKGAVHPHCGFPVKAAQDLAHLFDIGAEDRLFWFTDLGWMMGPWAIMGALSLGAACVLYEGAPDYPHPGRVWEMVDRHRITALGISPTAIRALMAHGPEVPARYDLSSLRILGGTGEPWNPASWSWYFEHVGRKRCPIINYSGGTEISGGILGCVTLRPIKPCSFNTPAPGMAVDVYDETGHPVRNQVGELVITNAWPGMTRGFWKDEARYLETYWSRWPGVWVHGDWALRDDEDFWYILGRSDDTIKIAGKRVGPAEVESAACSHPAVREAAAIGIPDELKGEALVVFAVLNEAPREDLRAEISARITEALGKTMKPEKVLFAADLPKTRNAKVLRRLIRAVHTAQPLGDTSSLENPATLEAIRTAS